MELYQSFRPRLLRKHILSTRQKMKVLSALNSASQTCLCNDDSKSKLDYASISDHGNEVMLFLQREQLYIKSLNELKKCLICPAVGETFQSLNDLIELVDEILSVHNTLYNVIISGESDLSNALQKLSSSMDIYVSYSFLTNLELNNFEKFSEVYSDSGRHIIDLLNEPLVHISKYISLFQNLNSAMPMDIYNDILNKVETTSNRIECASALRKNAIRMLQIQKLLIDRQPKILTPERKILKEGFLYMVGSKSSQLKKRVFFLFNDLLICCKVKLKTFDWYKKDSLLLCASFSLTACSVSFVMGCSTSEGALFKVTSDGASYLLMSKVPGESQSWVTEIQAAVRDFHKHSVDFRPKLCRKNAICIKQGMSPLLKRTVKSPEKSHTFESYEVEYVNPVEHNFKKSTFGKIAKFFNCLK